MKFVQIGSKVVPINSIREIDISNVEKGKIRVLLGHVYIDLDGVLATDFLMRVCPQVLEGKRLKWVRHAWVFHNMVAHPVMQFLAFVGLGKLGVSFHDKSIPRPK